MIQRIQTMWLLITAITPVYFFMNPLVKLKDSMENGYFLVFKGILHESTNVNTIIQRSVALPVLLILIPTLSIVAIFLYKKRLAQKTVSLVIFTLSVCLVIVTFYQSLQIFNRFNAIPSFSPGILIPPLLCVASILAYRGILRDDRLVKSYDRIR